MVWKELLDMRLVSLGRTGRGSWAGSEVKVHENLRVGLWSIPESTPSIPIPPHSQSGLDSLELRVTFRWKMARRAFASRPTLKK
jgi:hypothetical protein